MSLQTSRLVTIVNNNSQHALCSTQGHAVLQICFRVVFVTGKQKLREVT